MKKLIVHVAEVQISEESGMGRVAWHWKNEFEKRGYDFIHIGPAQVGPVFHKGIFPYAAYQAYQRLRRRADVFLVHEPASGPFLNHQVPTVVFSHGLERRHWELGLQGKSGTDKKVRWRTRIFFPLWRLRQCDLGLRKATRLLLSNQEDLTFAQNYYHQDKSRFSIHRNGVYPSKINESLQPKQITVLFLGNWTERKGVATLVEAAKILYKQGLRLYFLLLGTTLDKEAVLSEWPSELHFFVEVVPYYQRADEEEFLAKSNIFLLPSFFEGQSLALLQAMEAGRCCITTKCCGQQDLIQHGYNGLLHEPGDHQQLASLIEQCAKNEELRMSLGRNAKLSVKDRSWENVSVEVVAQIESVLFQKSYS